MTGIISDNVARTSGLIKAASGGGGGVWTKIKELTASSSADISFVNGSSDVVLDSTYITYLFKFINIHPSASSELSFNGSDDTSSHSYDIAKHTTAFYTFHREDDGGSTGVNYVTSGDLANGTGFQVFQPAAQIGTDNDECMCGEMYLFSPSDGTHVKHFISTNVHPTNDSNTVCEQNFIPGYFNTTAAITAIQFKMGSGNIDSGKIKLYGLKDSA